ncbi:MAG: 2OG-Fe(II) oxygenase [Herbaspirillum sp.]
MKFSLPLANPPLPDAAQRQLLDDLVTRGWAHQTGFLSAELTKTLAAECRNLNSTGALKPAAIGRGHAQTLQPEIRSDRILWLQSGQSPACDQYLTQMEALRMLLNQHLYLGLNDYESHFALYAPGATYQQHLDRFHDDDARTISCVTYLNQNWLDHEGGALRLHPPGHATQDIAPLGGDLILFLSAEIPHEVLPATRDRLSIAGWFRRRT